MTSPSNREAAMYRGNWMTKFGSRRPGVQNKQAESLTSTMAGKRVENGAKRREVELRD